MSNDDEDLCENGLDEAIAEEPPVQDLMAALEASILVARAARDRRHTEGA